MTCPYNDMWGYQENLLTKWQKRNGNEVTLLTTRLINNKNDDGFTTVDKETFVNNDGVKIIRLDWLMDLWPIRTLRIFKDFYTTLENEKPDFLFIPGCQFLDAIKVCRYLKKHKDVVAVVDNHADETNSAKSFFPKILHYTAWRFTAQMLNRYVKKFYGVLPIRCAFLSKYYNLPEDKIDLLVMGADDDLIEESRQLIPLAKEKYKIKSDSFNIVCGGKFDHYKREVLYLMEAVNELENVHLFIFGSIGDEIKERFEELLSEKITYAGWLNQKDSYALLQACDLPVFPGRHSVIWEQCVGLGLPLIVKKLPGTQHVDIGGNCIFIEDPDKDKIKNIIAKVMNDEQILKNTKEVAGSEKKNSFRYSGIARKSIETYQ